MEHSGGGAGSDVGHSVRREVYVKMVRGLSNTSEASIAREIVLGMDAR